jgi:hypothetical protein
LTVVTANNEEKVRKKLTWHVIEFAWGCYEHQETPKIGHSVNELKRETNTFLKIPQCFMFANVFEELFFSFKFLLGL